MTEVLEKTTTGLPELPEGAFWRIGEIPAKDRWGQTVYGTGGWASSVGGKMSAVQIMEVRRVRKHTEVPVYGDRWWNKHTVVRHEPKTWHEDEEVSVLTRLFTGYAARTLDDIPEHAVECGSSGPIGGPPTTYNYEYHVNADGARAIAEDMVKEYHRQVRQERAWRIAEEAKKRAKDELFGDYPPKTLEGK